MAYSMFADRRLVVTVLLTAFVTILIVAPMNGCLVHKAAQNSFVREIAPGVIEIRPQGVKVAEYRFGWELAKPYLCPVLAPDGIPVTEDSPWGHRHHHGVWIGYEQVNGHDFWTEQEPETRLRHDRFVRIFDQPQYPGFIARTHWESGGTTVMYDERMFRFRMLDNGDYAIDVAVTLRTESDTVTIEGAYGGLPAVRVAGRMRVTAGGRITNSEGGVNEEGTMHKRARWLDYCGRRDDGTWVGIAYLVHPDNRDFPLYWFVRDAGWFAPSYTRWGAPIVLKPDRPFTVRCRLIVHRGNTNEARIEERFGEYVVDMAR